MAATLRVKTSYKLNSMRDDEERLAGAHAPSAEISARLLDHNTFHIPHLRGLYICSMVYTLSESV